MNIFIGKPNTGKSNILEAISLLSSTIIPGKKFLEGSIYYEKINNLFNMLNNSQPISVISTIGAVQLSYFSDNDMFGYFADNNGNNSLLTTLNFSSSEDAFNNFLKAKKLAVEELEERDTHEKMMADLYAEREVVTEGSYFACQIDKDGLVKKTSATPRPTPIRSYHYNRQTSHGSSEIGYLLPPHGGNLLEVLQHTHKLQEIIGDFFKQFGFDIVLILGENSEENKIKIQKKSGAFHVQLPYSLVADTLQRMIFHLAAIYSNKKAVILFEEPEAHTYALYQSYLAGEIMNDELNQYFITTHSDTIFDSLVREAPEKVAVFIVGYDGNNTTVRPLSEEEIIDHLNNYTSIFQNLDKYNT